MSEKWIIAGLYAGEEQGSAYQTGPSCPVVYRQIDGNQARLTAAEVTVLLLFSLFTGSEWPAFFLVGDFFLRSGSFAKYSPLAALARLQKHVFGIGSKKVDAGPKIFASRIGLIFSGLLSILAVAEFTAAFQIVAILFVTCTFLEAAFGFCVACQIYPFWKKIRNSF